MGCSWNSVYIRRFGQLISVAPDFNQMCLFDQVITELSCLYKGSNQHVNKDVNFLLRSRLYIWMYLLIFCQSHN